MSHLTAFTIHGYKNRGLDVRIVVETAEDTTDFSNLIFTAGSIEKTGLTADDTTDGFNVDFTLTASEMNITTGQYNAELKGTLAGEVRTLAVGKLRIDPV